MSQLKPYKLELQGYLIYIFLTILFYHAFSSYSLHFLIPTVIAQIFIPITKLVIPTGTRTNETSAEIETQVVIVETKISNCST